MPAKSISDLRAELASKERQLTKLASARAALVKELARIDRRIAVLAGKARPGRVAKGRGRAVKKVRRRATGKPLVAYIKEALKSAKGGLSVTNVVKAVTKAGYKSHSKDFYAIVAKTLLTNDSFKRVKRGVYTLA